MTTKVKDYFMTFDVSFFITICYIYIFKGYSQLFVNSFFYK